MEWVIVLVLSGLGGLVGFAIGCRVGVSVDDGRTASLWEAAYMEGYNACKLDVKESTVGLRIPRR